MSSRTPSLGSGFSRAQSAPTGVPALRQASPHYSKINPPKHLLPAVQVLHRGVAGATAMQNMLIYSTSIFSDQHVQGIHLLQLSRLGAEESRETLCNSTLWCWPRQH